MCPLQSDGRCGEVDVSGGSTLFTAEPQDYFFCFIPQASEPSMNFNTSKLVYLVYPPGDVTPSWPVPDPDLEVRGGGGSPNEIFSVFQASVWSKNKGGEGRAPPVPSPGSATAGSLSHLPFSYRTNGMRQHKYPGVLKKHIVY